MLSLNTTDLLRGDASVDAKVDYTISALVANVFTVVGQGQLSNVTGTIVTAGASTGVLSIVLTNTHTVAVTVNLFYNPVGGASNRRLIPKDLSLGIGYSLYSDGTRFSVVNTSGEIITAGIATMVYPGIGIPVSTGSTWDTSLTATAESDFILSGASSFAWVRKTLAQVKTILGLSGTVGGNVPASTAANDFIVGDSTTGNWIKQTLAQTKTILNIETISLRSKYRNLVIIPNATHPTYQVDVTIDEIVLQTTDGLPFRATAVSKTIDITASGSNGLDTGSEASSTWYYIWIIAKADGTVAGLLSASSTSPTMPTGYIYMALVGAVRNNGSSNFVAFGQKDNRVSGTLITVLSGGTSGSVTSIDLAVAVPAIAKRANIQFNGTNSSGTTINAVAYASSTALEQVQQYAAIAGATSVSLQTPAALNLLTPQTIWYSLATGSNVYIYVQGWEY